MIRKRKGFPRHYRSPFKKFLVPSGRMGSRNRERVFALVDVETVRLYEGEHRVLTIPVELPARLRGRKRLGKVTEKLVRKQFRLGPGSRKRIRLVKIHGLYALKGAKARRRLKTVFKKKAKAKGGRVRHRRKGKHVQRRRRRAR